MPVYGKKGFDPHKTNIRRAYFCTSNQKHKVKVKLEKYREKTYDKIKRFLYICPDCGKLYFKSATYCVPTELGEESILISNIDSPKNNSIECLSCGKTAYRANNDPATEHYFCPDCFTMTRVKKNINGEDLYQWFPVKGEI